MSGIGRRSLWLFMAVVVAVVTSGCAGIVNRHLSWDKDVKPDQGEKPLNLDQAVTYAERAKEAYRGALGNHSRFTNALGIGIIPLMAAAAGLGITGGPPAVITATTLTGATAYGIGIWLESKPHQRAWLAGYNATNCAISAVAPYRYVSQQQKLIETHIRDLDLKRDAVVGARNAVHQAVADARQKENLKKVLPAEPLLLKQADALLAETASTRSNAVKMLGQADNAGTQLKNAVDQIYGKVATQIVETAQDVQALAGIVGGIIQNYKGFMGAVEPLKPRETSGRVIAQAGDEPLDDEAQRALKVVDDFAEILKREMAALTMARQTLADDLERATATISAEGLAICGPLSVDPPGDITFDEKTPVNKVRLVRGGAPPFLVTLHGSLTDLTVSPVERGKGDFEVKATDKTPAGEATVYVSDATGGKLIVPVVVKSKGTAGAGAGTGRTGAGSGGAGAVEGTPPPADAKALKEIAAALRGANPGVTSVVTAAVDDAVLKEVDRISVDVSLRKGAALITPQESAAIGDVDIVKALLTLPAVQGKGLDAKHFVIRLRKPAQP